MKGTNVFQQLVEKRSVMEERITVVDSEIQHLEERLSSLKVEKIIFTDRFSQKVEEMEKTSQGIEDSKSQLVNNNMHLGEPHRIFTIMQTYFSQIIALVEYVKLLY